MPDSKDAKDSTTYAADAKAAATSADASATDAKAGAAPPNPADGAAAQAPLDAPSLAAPVQEGACPAGFKKINILKSHILTLQDASRLNIGAGVQYLPEEVADHWWVRSHSDDPPVIEMKAGSAQELEAKMAQAARLNITDIVIEQAAQEAANRVRDQLRNRGRGTKPAA